MYKEVTNDITVKSIIDVRYPRKDGTFPVRIQVFHNKLQKYYNTGKEMSKDDWDKLPNTRQPDLLKIKTAIKRSFDLIQAGVVELAAQGSFSFNALNIRIGQASGGNINELLKNKIEALKEEGRIGSMDFYKAILVSIEKFAGTNIAIGDVSVDWLGKYERWMLAAGLKYSSVGMRMRGIRAIMNTAKRNGLIKEAQYPFGRGKYEIQTGTSRKKALSLEHISLIVHYDDGNETTSRYRDIWYFIYMCNGINVADLVNLKYSDIDDGEICFVRKKTQRTTKTVKEIRAIITPQMEEIIARWGNPRQPNNYIFPLIRRFSDPEKHSKEVKDLTRRINKRTKMIGTELGIGNITTYTARHSFATVLKRSGANITYISESLGHTDLKTTESYLASFEKSERQKNANFLTCFDEIPQE